MRNPCTTTEQPTCYNQRKPVQSNEDTVQPNNNKQIENYKTVYYNINHVLKSRDITLPTKVYIGKTMVFPLVMYGCESWTIKKAECRRIDAFELWLEKTLESPLDYKEIKPVSPKENQP